MMTYVSKFRAAFDTALAAIPDSPVQRIAMQSPGRLAAAIVAKLRVFAPYAMIELVLPGGSLIALLLWLYRRPKKMPVVSGHEAIGGASICCP